MEAVAFKSRRSDSEQFDFDDNDVITGDDALCSGSLISPTVFLTAAHCVEFFEPGAQLYVSFNADLFDRTRRRPP